MASRCHRPQPYTDPVVQHREHAGIRSAAVAAVAMFFLVAGAGCTPDTTTTRQPSVSRPSSATESSTSAPSTPTPEITGTPGAECATTQLQFRAVYATDVVPTNPGTQAPATAASRPAPALPTVSTTPRPMSPTTDPNAPGLLDTLLAWQPSAQDLTDFAVWGCADYFPDVWDQPLFACSADGSQKFLLGPLLVSGRNLTGATAKQSSGQATWQVDLLFNAVGTSQFAVVTQHLYDEYVKDPTRATSGQLALVLDLQVLSAPVVTHGAIATGNITIGGGLDQASAQRLAQILSCVSPTP